MSLFRYKVATTAGEVLEGEMEAGSQDAVIKRLQAQGHIPIRAEEVAGGRKTSGAQLSLFRPRRVGQREVTVITLELSSMLHAGVSLDRALDILIDLAENDAVAEMLSAIHTKVRGGSTLSDAMEAQEGVFSRFYLNMVRAGEAGGALDVSLARLAEFMERAREFRQTVGSALAYPIILVLVAVVSLTVILAFVVPRFSQMFEDAGQELPMVTQFVVGVGGFVEQYWWVIALLGVGIYFIMRRRLQDPESRLAWDGRLLRLPMIGTLITKVDTARFMRTLGTLLGNGVPLPNAVNISREIVANRVIAEGIGGIATRIRQGEGLAKPLQETDIFPKLAGQMLQVGEETGNLEGMLLKLTEIYEREVQTSVRRMITIAEPVLILGLGLVIGGIIMSIVVAILGVNDLAL